MYISSDTNIWIDFDEIGRLEHPFRLEFTYCISQDTFDGEFIKSQTLRDDLKKLGLQTVQITNEEFTEAITYQARYPALSTYDTFALAIAKKRRWTLLTGDMPLRRAAASEKVECHGTIWVYDQLKAQGKMTEEEYDFAIGDLIQAVQNGRCRLPMSELLGRKRP